MMHAYTLSQALVERFDSKDSYGKVMSINTHKSLKS